MGRIRSDPPALASGTPQIVVARHFSSHRMLSAASIQVLQIICSSSSRFRHGTRRTNKRKCSGVARCTEVRHRMLSHLKVLD